MTMTTMGFGNEDDNMDKDSDFDKDGFDACNRSP